MSRIPPETELKRRLALLRSELDRLGIAAALITDERNVRYLSGFTGTDSALLIMQQKKFLLSDFRFVEEARATARGWRLKIHPPALMEKAGVEIKKLRLRKVAVEPGDLRLIDLKALQKHARGVKFVRVEGLVEPLRMQKSDWEVAQIERALRIQEEAFAEFCAELKPGISERQAAAKLRYIMAERGADDQAFQTMVQFGPNSSWPHGGPTDRVLRGDSLVLVDWGARVAGYHSDLTRTFFIGTIPRHLREIFEVVREAQRRAIALIAPNVELVEVDAAARKWIDKAGFGAGFQHSTGHGIGLHIHELPSLSKRAKGKLAQGMVVTVEPGVYIPGVGGIRIEDDVLVTAAGHRVLSRLKSGLRWNGDDS